MQNLVLVTAMLSLSAFCITDDSFVFLSFSLVAAALSGVLAQGARPRRLPTIVAHSIIALLVAAAAAWAFIDDRPPDTGQVGLLCGAALVNKLFARHRAVDERHVLALSSILLLVAALDGTDVLAGLPLVLGSLLMPVCAAAVWVQSSTERAAAAHASRIPSGALPVAFEPAVGASPRRSWTGFAVASVVVTAVCSVLVFLGFPRQGLEGETWSRTRSGGLSLRVSLASDERIEDSRTEVMTVRWIAPDGVAIEHIEPLHLRGAVFDLYDPISQSWQVPQQPRRKYVDGAVDAFVPFVESGIDPRFQVYRQVVQMRGLATNQIFSVLAPISIQAVEGMTVALDQSTMLLSSASSRIGEFDRYAVSVKPYASDRDMMALSGGSIEPGPMPAFPVVGVRERALELWEQWKPRDRAVPSYEDARDRPSARWERNRAIAAALQSALLSGDFRYTTDLGSIVRRRGEDPIVNFLTRSRRGHCQYFASALCAMCQSMGVDARVVAGFIALEYDESQSLYIVRSSNAHAWVEVRTGDAQWTTFDGTPPTTLEALQAQQRSWADGLRWLWDPLNFAWTRHVVSFDVQAQAELADRMASTRETLSRPVRAVRETLDAIRRRLVETFSGLVGGLWLTSIGMVLTATVVVVALLRARRCRTSPPLGPDASPRERDLARHYLDALRIARRRGAVRRPGMTPLDVAEELALQSPEAAAHLRSVVESFYAVHFGGRPATAERCSAAERDLAELQRARTR
jgi:transglutaminase-like putative cysteine protease